MALRPTVLAALAASLALLVGCGDEEKACSGPACASTSASTGTGGEGGQGQFLMCPEGGVLHGPWSLHVDDTSAVVRWDACAKGSADLVVKPEEGGAETMVSGTQTAAEVNTTYDVIDGVEPDLPGTYYTTEVQLTGLTPGACYLYDLVAEPGRGGRVCTAKPAGDPFRFMAIGDTNPFLGATTDVLASALAHDPDFVVHLGDIQYYASVFESYRTWFPAMAPMLRQGGFFPSIGNHESEIPYEFEDYYTRLFGGAGFDGQLEWYRFESGGVWFFSLDTETGVEPGSAQAQWLEAQLADAASQPGYRFSVVYFHRPFLSVGDVSSNDSAREHFAPIFEQFNVKLILQGHMHGYERFVAGPLTYITSGGGGGALGDVDENVADNPELAALRVASGAEFHSVVFEVGTIEIVGMAIGRDGRMLDTFSIPLP